MKSTSPKTMVLLKYMASQWRPVDSYVLYLYFYMLKAPAPTSFWLKKVFCSTDVFVIQKLSFGLEYSDGHLKYILFAALSFDG